MSNPVDPPEDIIERHVVGKLRYSIDQDTGNVTVAGVPGVGRAVLDALAHNGYRVVLVDRTRRIRR